MSKMPKIYFITGNKNKLAEAKMILGEDVEGLDIDLPEIQENDVRKIIQAKVSEARRLGYDDFFVEDVSFHLDCLNGFPGPLIKWFLGTVRKEGIYEICKGLDNFSAITKSNIGLFYNGEISFFEGAVKGKVIAPVKGGGFGFDSIFLPEGYDKTYSQMNAKEKNSMSHRKNSLCRMRNYLMRNFIGD